MWERSYRFSPQQSYYPTSQLNIPFLQDVFRAIVCIAVACKIPGCIGGLWFNHRPTPQNYCGPLGIDRIRTSQCALTLNTRVYGYTATLIKNNFLRVSNVRKFERKVCCSWLLKIYSVGVRHTIAAFRWKNRGWRDAVVSKKTCAASTAT